MKQNILGFATLVAGALLLATPQPMQAQRTTDKLDRGLVAVPSGNGSFVSWRIFGEEYYDTEYNLYRDGELIAGPLSVSNYTDAAGKSGSKYQVAAVVRGVEQAKCAEVTRLSQQYIQFAVKDVYSRSGANITSDYSINDIALADVDGDGVSEFIMKRNYVDGSSVDATAFNLLECYNIKGDRLWYIDLGPNMVSGPDEQYDAVGYDWDGDGKAEILMRGADNMIIYHSDGTTTNIGNMSVNTRNTVLQTANMTYTNTGAEYLLYLDGATGKPYEIGSGSTPYWMTYPLPRGAADDWGDGYGHRSTKHYFGAPFLDGRHPFIFLGRGCYTRHMMKAYSVDPDTHKLSLYWSWEDNNGWSSPYYGQGYHNFGIADVDWDGRDEICFGSMVIDDNGKGLSTTGLGHGDAQHCSDFDPYRHGQEIFACNEDHPAMNFRNATTSQIYYRLESGSDDGRALCGNFSNDYPGAMGHSSQSGTISCVADKPIAGGPGGFTNNFRIYWDGDLLEEGLDGASSREGAARVFKADGSIVFTADGTANCNWTKNTPSAQGDILGDWREEIIVRTSDNKYVRVYTTNIATPYRNYTLWHDHQYRQGMVWESIGYNQPPHASYFLGELEGITVAPPPFTMTGRTEVANGGTITSADEHLIVCETNDTEISIADGASPYMVTFNVPSWVQGTNSTLLNGNAVINRTYYTCNVTGGGLSGATRLVKQGDGILNLPSATFTHTGETNIWAGTFNFNGTMLKSDLWLNRFAVLNGSAAFKSIKADYGSVVRPGGEGKIGTIAADSTIYLGFGSRVVFDLDGETFASDTLSAKGIVIETKNWSYGPKYMMPVIELAGNVAAGTYCIAKTGSITGSLSNLKVEGTNGLKCALSYEDGKILLTLGSVRGASHIYWTGSVNQTWDYATTENFALADGDNLVPDVFVQGDIAEFNDDAQNFNVTLSDEFTVDTFLVNNTTAYTFSGTGKIVGGAFVKEGAGKVTLSNDNTYTGGNFLRGGTTVVSSLASNTQAFGCLGAPVSSTALFVMSNGAVLQTTAAVQNASPIRFQTAEGGVLFCGAAFTQQKALYGTVCTKKGSGTLTLSTANGSLTKMVIAGGSVAAEATPAASVEMQGGTLSLSGSSSVPVTVTGNNTAIYCNGDRATYSNALSGNGRVIITYPFVVGSDWYATRAAMNGNWSAFEGTVVPTTGIAADGRFCLNNSYGMANGTMEIPSGTTVENTGKTFAIGRLTGYGNLGGTCSLSSSANTAVNTWNVGNDSSFVFDGTVVSNAVFNKVGDSQMTVTGRWSTTGAVSIKQGSVLLNTKLANLGSGKLTIGQNGTLISVDDTIRNSSVVVDGLLYPGNYLGDYRGTMYFNGQNVTINAGGTLRVCMRKAGTSATVIGGSGIRNIGKLTLNGTLQVDLYKTYTPKVGDALRFVADVTTIVGTPTIVCSDENIVLDGSRLSEGIVVVVGLDGTSIENIVNPASAIGSKIHDLHGREVPADRLERGMTYICNGRKFVY